MKKILVLASAAALLVGCGRQGNEGGGGAGITEPSGAGTSTNMHTNGAGSKMNEPSGARGGAYGGSKGSSSSGSATSPGSSGTGSSGSSSSGSSSSGGNNP